MQQHIEDYITDARLERESRTKARSRRKKPLEEPDDSKVFDIQEQEEPAHRATQNQLIKLGRITGCSIWIASNDRNRLYRGKSLGAGCLEHLPNLGLSQEATKRIALIDVIWIRQNTPLCAFEIETTTSVFSGLLRMSDLLSVVPAINIKLFIVAPRQRQKKVMDELGRPTFQRIGLSEYCRFIAIEELDALLSRIAGLEGHVQASILDTIAIELEDGLESGLK